jgi:glycerol uptake facilitator-like aquaporin
MAEKKSKNASLLSNLPTAREIVAELLGTFGLSFAVLASAKAAAGAAVVGSYNSLDKVVETVQKLGTDPASGVSVTGSTFIIATGVVAAFTLAIFVLTIGAVSGSNINPAVTFGLWASGQMKAHKAISYFLAQFAGAFGAFAVAAAFLGGQSYSKFVATGDWKVFAAEAIGTMIFTFGVGCAVIGKKAGVEAALMVGGSLFLGIVFAGFVSGAGVLNPAVALALKSFSWAHVAGPLVGGIVGVFVAFFLNAKHKEFSFFGLNSK